MLKEARELSCFAPVEGDRLVTLSAGCRLFCPALRARRKHAEAAAIEGSEAGRDVDVGGGRVSIHRHDSRGESAVGIPDHRV